MNAPPPPPFAAEATRCRTAQQAWATTSVRERLQPVREFRHRLSEVANELAALVQADVGRRADEVVGTDVLPTADACRFLEREAARLLKPRRVPRRQRPLWLMGERSVVHRRPHGVVAIIGTWNYPIYLNAIQIVQALTAGNGVLWKPSELVPKTAERLHDLLLECGYPPDLFLRLPATREAGPRVAETEVDHVVFTGSADVGRKLARRLGERLVSSTLELSGCDAFLVLPDADAELAARAAWYGIALNAGQTCLAVRRAFVHRSHYAGFVERLRSCVTVAAPVPLALKSQVEQANRLVDEAVAAGAKVLRGTTGPAGEQRFAPTVLVDATVEMGVCREASFAPLLAVIPFDDVEAAMRMNAQCGYGLGSSIFTSNKARAAELAGRLTTGYVCVNDVIAPTAHPATPFGGRGASGWGVTQGPDGLLGMTVPQVVSYRGGRFRPHYDGLGGADPAVDRTVRGLLQWGHARSVGKRLRGFWEMVRGMMATGKAKGPGGAGAPT